MEKPIQIRHAHLKDAEFIAQFNTAMAKETENKELDASVIARGVNAVFENPQYGFYLVAEADQQVLGSLMVTTEWSDWRNGFFWWIQSVYIRSDYRRRGIYSQLHHFVKKLAQQESNVCGIRLYVEHQNHPAQKTYASLGMSKTDYLLFEEEF
ncbi:MAG: GNAT family N-acetyltransferase [SAR324 cluster bacterium]|nr:GNAT family N-acetyltransferase [SAR324 cluster bacterium]